MNTLLSYFEQYALVSLEKQEKLRALITEPGADLDLETGAIRLGALEFPFQVLGTESDNTLTWLWAWADEQAEVQPGLLRSALQMKAWGAAAGVPECTMPSVDIDRADGMIFALIASEVCKASAFYHEVYEGGGLYVLLTGAEIERMPGFTADSLSREFSFLAGIHDFDHAAALRSFFSLKSLPYSEHATFIVGELDSGEDLRANFDAGRRLATINGREIDWRHGGKE